MRTSRGLAVAMLLAFSAGAAQAANSSAECPQPSSTILFASCHGESHTRLVRLEREGTFDAAEGGARTVLTVTGAYTSGERREPEGFFLVKGDPYDPYPQGWDGIALIDAEGGLTLHHVERVSVGEDRWNLRVQEQRKAFLQRAREERWSALQSHMLVIDGKADTSPRADAPRFRRRLLFSDATGAFGIYDSGAESLTLHDVATRVVEELKPRMAFNLDMGSYDFCELRRDGELQNCGLLSREQTGKLSNLLIFTQTPTPKSRKAARLDAPTE